MAACRGLDVPARRPRRPVAVPAAAVVALHTVGVTAQSRGEVHGGSSRVALAGARRTAASAAAAVGSGCRGDRPAAAS